MTPRARIFQLPKSTMQSGRANTQEWLLEFEPGEAQRADPLMGWNGSADTKSQIRLHFATQDEAIAYAKRENLQFDVELPRNRIVKPKSYSDNFQFGRTDNWTH